MAVKWKAISFFCKEYSFLILASQGYKSKTEFVCYFYLVKHFLLIAFFLSSSMISESREVIWSRIRKLSLGDFRIPIIEKPQIEGEIAEREYI
jgi:hypothetical protein